MNCDHTTLLVEVCAETVPSGIGLTGAFFLAFLAFNLDHRTKQQHDRATTRTTIAMMPIANNMAIPTI